MQKKHFKNIFKILKKHPIISMFFLLGMLIACTSSIIWHYFPLEFMYYKKSDVYEKDNVMYLKATDKPFNGKIITESWMKVISEYKEGLKDGYDIHIRLADGWIVYINEYQKGEEVMTHQFYVPPFDLHLKDILKEEKIDVEQTSYAFMRGYKIGPEYSWSIKKGPTHYYYPTGEELGISDNESEKYYYKTGELLKERYNNGLKKIKETEFYKNGNKKSEMVINNTITPIQNDEGSVQNFWDSIKSHEYNKKAWYDNGNIKYSIRKFKMDGYEGMSGECFSINGESINLNRIQIESIIDRDGIECSSLFR